jgi:hypothetical protein
LGTIVQTEQKMKKLCIEKLKQRCTNLERKGRNKLIEKEEKKR